MRCSIFWGLILGSYCSYGQLTDNYRIALDSIVGELTSAKGSFKKAVFWVENASFDNHLSFEKFDSKIAGLTHVVTLLQQRLQLKAYRYPDSVNLVRNYALFEFMKDTTRIILNADTTLYFLPYTYDFFDFDGREDRSSMFVTKLLATQTGNCHNLPYLYKILADEIGATCWLSLAPNHIYIKNRCKKIGWYNTELTSGCFPIDAWIATSGYVPLQAIQNGIYMDTLSNRQAIALCVLDLAKGYEFQARNYEDGFIIQCCDLVLQFHPVNVQAMLLKAETLKRIYEKQSNEKDATADDTYRKMEQLYVKLFELGYREMPDQMYQQWLQSMAEQKEKYDNQQIKAALTGK